MLDLLWGNQMVHDKWTAIVQELNTINLSLSDSEHSKLKLQSEIFNYKSRMHITEMFLTWNWCHSTLMLYFNFKWFIYF